MSSPVNTNLHLETTRHLPWLTCVLCNSLYRIYYTVQAGEAVKWEKWKGWRLGQWLVQRKNIILSKLVTYDSKIICTCFQYSIKIIIHTLNFQSSSCFAPTWYFGLISWLGNGFSRKIIGFYYGRCWIWCVVGKYERKYLLKVMLYLLKQRKL